MRYLPSLGFGFILTLSVVYLFDLSSRYSPLLDYLISTPELNANSSEYYLLMLHDSVIPIVLASIIVAFYRKLLPNYPFNILAMILMQFHITFTFIRINGIPNRFDNTYESAKSVATISACISVLVVFVVIVAYNKLCKRDC